MKRSSLPFIGLMVTVFFLIALFQSPITMYLGGILFALAALQAPWFILAFLAFCAIFVFSLLFEHILAGGYLALTFILPGIVIGQWIRQKRSLSECVAFGAAAYLLPELLFLRQISIFNQTTIRDMLMQSTKEYTAAYIERYGEEAGKMLEPFVSLYEDLLPAILVISAITFSFLLLAAVKYIMRRQGMPPYWMRPLSWMKMSPAFTALGLLSVLGAYAAEGAPALILLNVAVVLAVLYTATGLAFSVRLLKKRVPSNVLCAVAIILAWFLTSGALYLFMGIIASFTKDADIHRTNH